ncbi:MAG: RsmE family RNA methyltransferase, partial [Actinomycetota bacterium]
MTTTHAPFFFTEPELISASEAVLQGDDARHLATVRRARAGDIIRIGDGEGLVLEARLVSVGSSEVTAEVEREERFERESPVVTVLQGLAKGSKLEIAVQKLVELGVDEIVIFVSGRSVPRHDE